VHLNFNTNWLLKKNNGSPLKLQKELGAKVIILKLFPGIDPGIVAHILNCPDLEGVVLETYGAGNAPSAKWFTKLIRDTIKRKVPVVNVTQCISGSVLMGHYETSMHLKEAGVIDGKNITTESALAKLKLLLGKKIPFARLKSEFETPIRGELG
jgi:L-asparaginase